MGYPDIERARSDQAALKAIIERYVGEAADLRALRRVVDLCRDLAEAIDDEYCRGKVRVVEEFSAELLSRSAPARGEFLKQHIAAALELLQSRLYSLERERRYGQQGLFGLRPQHAIKR
jgi:hypothetical protein